MYLEFYGLVRPPFEMTPDPAFLYLGETHREGLATLLYGVQARKGFVLLTGEVGTGKTTLLHALLAARAEHAAAFLFNPRLDPLDFFRVLFDEFGIEKACRTKAEYLLALNHFLIERLETRPDDAADHRRGAEPLAGDARGGPAALEPRDAHVEAAADHAGGAAGARTRCWRARAAPAPPADRAAPPPAAVRPRGGRRVHRRAAAACGLHGEGHLQALGARDLSP